MTNTPAREWERELDAIRADIDAIRAAHSRSRLAGNKSLIARKIAIIQGQLQLERHIESLQQIAGRDHLLLPRERAMVHGAKQYVERLQNLVSIRTRILTRSLWLQLIKTRMMGDDGKAPGDIDADDLVALSIRLSSLKKTEQYLGDTLTRLRQRRRELTYNYDQLGVIDANRTAAQSFASRLGATSAEALRSPTLKALAHWLKTVAAPISARAAQERLSAMDVQGEEQAATGLDMARSLVTNRLHDPQAVMAPRHLETFQAAMAELDALEKQTRQAYDQILAHAPAASPPILVQKPSRQAKILASAAQDAVRSEEP